MPGVVSWSPIDTSVREPHRREHKITPSVPDEGLPNVKDARERGRQVSGAG